MTLVAWEWQWELILDYILVLIWPLLVALVVVYLLRRYGTQFGGLIDRIKTVKVFGTEMGFTEAADQQRAAADEEAAEGTLDDNPDDAELIDQLTESYEQRLAEQQLEAAEERRRLLRQVAVKSLQVEYEQIYRVIYGSQIAALRSIRASPDEIAPREALEAHMNQVKSTLTLIPFVQAMTFETWIGYLVTSGLAIQREEDRDTYRITSKGSGFLDYIDAGRFPRRVF